MSEKCISTNINTMYEQENQMLADDFLQTYFFNSFHKSVKGPSKKDLELIISPKCNLGCRYCYIHKHRKDIFDENIFNEEITLKNLKLVLSWMEKHEFNPNLDLFSGELFAQEIGFKILEIIYEHEARIAPDLRCQAITIPTNFTFLNSDELTTRIKDLQAKFLELDIFLFLSASFDGLHMEQNRPYTKNLDFKLNIDRDEAYYDKVFEFCSEQHCGLHPMIYSKNIEHWKDNFLWFQEMMEKHDIAWEYLYLLNVRNEEWDDESISQYMKFIEFLYDWTFEKVGNDPELLVNFILKAHGFNILQTPFSINDRGLTCGLQQSLNLRLSDLMIYPCHRTGYEQYYCGQFVPDENEVLKYQNKRAELLITAYSVHKEGFPGCAECPVNILCTGQCIGACHESNNNLFVPIPTVCVTTYALLAATIKGLKKCGAYEIMLRNIQEPQIIQLEYVKKELNL